jgi:hypothetical protein
VLGGGGGGGGEGNVKEAMISDSNVEELVGVAFCHSIKVNRMQGATACTNRGRERE